MRDNVGENVNSDDDVENAGNANDCDTFGEYDGHNICNIKGNICDDDSELAFYIQWAHTYMQIRYVHMMHYP